jgi:rubredoxin
MTDLKNNFIRVCPVCGFSFQAFDPISRKPKDVCPMCGYKFQKQNLFPQKPRETDKKFL